MKQTIFTLLIITVSIWWMLHTLQQANLYHPDSSDFPDPAMALKQSPYANQVEEVWFKTADGVRLNGWYHAGPAGKPTIVFCHGNGGNIGDRWEEVETFVKGGYGFLMFDYRGYGKSGGASGEQGLYRDVDAAVQYLVKEQKVPVEDQIPAGESLGGAVAIDAAARYPFRAVVVHSTFTTVPEVAVHLRDSNQMAWLHYLPMHLIMWQRFDSLSKIERVTAPLLIAHHDNDYMIPSFMAQRLYDRAGSKIKHIMILKGNTHGVPGVIIEPELAKLLEESAPRKLQAQNP